jgi:hypothetical protein
MFWGKALESAFPSRGSAMSGNTGTVLHGEGKRESGQGGSRQESVTPRVVFQVVPAKVLVKERPGKGYTEQ